MTRVGGMVLCGGQSKRMGRPKAWLPFGDEFMLQRVVRILATVLEPIVVVAAREEPVPPLPSGAFVVRDEQPGRGPLQGLATGLKALEGKCEAAYVSSCDAPFLQPTFVQRMVELLHDHALCVPFVHELYHPLAAVYRLDVQKAVQRLFAAQRLRQVDLIEEVLTRTVLAHELADVDPALQTLRNVNTPEEYAAALHDAGFTAGETGGPGRGA
jgi:molybdenum cofactor guanylyltransferase